MAARLKAFWDHPAGPKTSEFSIMVDLHDLTCHLSAPNLQPMPNNSYLLAPSLHLFLVHFWAPTFKWGISIANIADMSRPAEKISLPQQIGKTDF